ncbi:uncharacterized protein LOC119686341 isoform X3 [Teleopsis dalmanni]|uniref:uncharacterized protein LOC119686341 isoform X3 n=1 Tax=Teleopsis dalmanni TaxID=139649 RepID=UPI0018CF68FF|nr:uncharacterized protein LOC119686341 isoform X3 [Teleopsis dalmanni]
MQDCKACKSLGQNPQDAPPDLSTNVEIKNEEIGIVPVENVIVEPVTSTMNQAELESLSNDGDTVIPKLCSQADNYKNSLENTTNTAPEYDFNNNSNNLLTQTSEDQFNKSGGQTQGFRQQKLFTIKDSVLNKIACRNHILKHYQKKRYQKQKIKKILKLKMNVKILKNSLRINKDKKILKQNSIETNNFQFLGPNECKIHNKEPNLSLDFNVNANAKMFINFGKIEIQLEKWEPDTLLEALKYNSVESSHHFYDGENLSLQSNECITEKFAIMATDLINSLEEFSRQNCSHQIHFEKLIKIFEWPKTYLPIKLNFDKAITNNIRKVKEFLLAAPEFGIIAMEDEHFSKYPKSLLKLYQQEEDGICSNKLNYTLKFILLTVAQVKYVMPFIWIEPRPVIRFEQNLKNFILKQNRAKKLTMFILDLTAPEITPTYENDTYENGEVPKYRIRNIFNNNCMNTSGIMYEDLIKLKVIKQASGILKKIEGINSERDIPTFKNTFDGSIVELSTVKASSVNAKQLFVIPSLEQATPTKADKAVLSISQSLDVRDQFANEYNLFAKANWSNICEENTHSFYYDYIAQDTMDIINGLIETSTSKTNADKTHVITDEMCLLSNTSEIKNDLTVNSSKKDENRINDDCQYILEFKDKFAKAFDTEQDDTNSNTNDIISQEDNFTDPHKFLIKNGSEETYTSTTNDIETEDMASFKYQRNELSQTKESSSEDANCSISNMNQINLQKIIFDCQTKKDLQNISNEIDRANDDDITLKLPNFFDCCKFFTPLKLLTTDIIDFIVFTCLHLFLLGFICYLNKISLFGTNRLSTTIYLLPITLKLLKLIIKFFLISKLDGTFQNSYYKSIAEIFLNNNEVCLTNIGFISTQHCIINSTLKYLPWFIYVPICFQLFQSEIKH